MRHLIVLFFGCITTLSSHAQIDVDPRINKQDLKEFFEQNGSLEVIKIKYKGARRAIGKFEDPDSIFNMNSGLILSTGAAKKIARENESTHTSSRNWRKGYLPVKEITKKRPKDAAVIKLTFIPTEEYISFNYVFGSDEYPEFVKSNFNDGFAFFLKVPGEPIINLATIPDSNGIISINNVNHLRNQCYYINNTTIYGKYKTVHSDTMEFWKRGSQYQVVTTYNIASAIVSNPGIPVEFDGFTKLLQAKAKVVPGEKHRLTICIADASDRIYDSGVLIESGSFQANKDKDFKFGALATDSNYYFKRDTTLIYSPPIQKEIIPTIERIDSSLTFHHAFNRESIQLDEQQTLVNYLRSLPSEQEYNVSVRSFADKRGSTNYNLELSNNRAHYLEAFINELGLLNITVSSILGEGKDDANDLPFKEQRVSIIKIESSDP
jgi:hypothetical protein